MTQYVQEKVAHSEKPIIAWAFVAFIAILLSLYAFFVYSSIVNIVSAKTMQKEIAVLTSRIGVLESEYVALKSNLSLAYAEEIGFSKPGHAPQYIQIVSGDALSLRQ